ncbi:MAG: dienelactone hydrolase family protein [Drouetiella hepatica Uher 2000/2452]|jgi:carboxymethylenebutenolidase|uniref:Dienelactone hydrolase family protein n=1 Tax=Drouetiella hepatica Uher 2000/2452 TaxID=904376 RepID=A0A951Q8Z8_9CYAN|nr:dienelactone hydrolase family protein [Drouetiella hepatica Uher 2000/2452]
MKRRDLLMASSGIAAATLLTRAEGQAIAAMPTTPGAMVTLAGDLKGYYVHPSGTVAHPAVVVIMEAFGLNAYVKSVCDRLAQAGYAALAPDFYYGDTFEYTNVSAAVAKLKTLKDDTVMTEFGKGLEFLASRMEVKPGAVGTIGFCMGGRFVYLASATHADKLKAGVSFYGGGIAANPDPLGRKALLDLTPAIQSPIMLMYGANDQSIAPDEHERIALSLSTNKKRYAINVFPDADHGFFSDRRDNYNSAASDEAWAMTLAFFQRHLA